MKAIVFTKYGSPDSLELKEIEQPTPKNNEILIKVHAASINSWDWELLLGTPFANRIMFGLLKPKKINILGCDIAGSVVAVGENATRFRIGDNVFGDLSGGGWGGFAEYVCAGEDELTLKPSNISFEEAASVPQAALLALQGLRYDGNICKGQKVLINGASGGVGTFAVQMAKLFGAEVTGVCSSAKMELVHSLGADHVIDYTQEDFTKNGHHYDLILDVKGCHPLLDYKHSLSPKGVYSMVGACSSLATKVIFLGPLISIFSNVKMGLMMHKPHKDMAFMCELLQSGKVVPVIDKSFALSKVPEALKYFADGHAKGKVVITVEHNDGTNA